MSKCVATQNNVIYVYVSLSILSFYVHTKKNTGRRRSSHDTDANDDDVVDCAAAAQKRHSLRSTTSFCDELFMEEETEATTTDAISLGNNSLLNTIGAAADEGNEPFMCVGVCMSTCMPLYCGALPEL